MIVANNLGCARGDRLLFSRLSFGVAPGELLHVTGSNGVGKTTLLRALCGLTRPTEGEILWRDKNIRRLDDEYRAQLAHIGHTNGLQGELTPRENLIVSARLTGAVDPESIDRALHTIGLSGLNHLPAKVLSQGQKRRLALARLLVSRKPLWILDEPLSALDVGTTAMMAAILAEHVKGGGIIIMTSHQEVSMEPGVITRLDLDQHINMTSRAQTNPA